MSATWRARLDEHLGNYTVEGLAPARGEFLFDASHAIYGVTHLAALMRLLPERDPHAALYDASKASSSHLDDARLQRADGRALRTAGSVRTRLWSRSRTLRRRPGGSGDLVYVSPKSGRAVSRSAGEPWADKMLRLPAFLRERDAMPAGSDIADGFALTGYFLTRHVLEPRGLALGDERAHFIAALNRASAERGLKIPAPDGDRRSIVRTVPA